MDGFQAYRPGTAADNVLYYLTPETIATIKKADGGTSAAGRHASDGEAPPSTATTIPQAGSGVKSSSTGPGDAAEVTKATQESTGAAGGAVHTGP